MYMRKCCLAILFYFCCILLLGGCASLKETAKGVAGISTKVLQDERASAISQRVNYGYETCYNKSQEILKKAGSYIYAKNKEMIAVYISENDTTPVGFFFKSIDGSNTEISVSSPSTYAKELLSKILFRGLDRMLHPEKYPKEPEEEQEKKE
ncbi:MAG: hypothetical protein FJZ08_02835 [Candidatus Omnitrophica bacterium]|nr:hypothetical protein [Candidatus Omnitrophota bacterium]